MHQVKIMHKKHIDVQPKTSKQYAISEKGNINQVNGNYTSLSLWIPVILIFAVGFTYLGIRLATSSVDIQLQNTPQQAEQKP